MNKTGLVLKIEKNIAVLATSTGEFVKVAISAAPPKIGETYTGAIKSETSYFRHFAAAAALFIFCLFGGSAYAYNTPSATVHVSINPSIELNINPFNRIIKSSPINNDGETLLKQLQLKNKNIDDALVLIVNQAKKDNFINDNYIASGRTITVNITAKNDNKIIKLDKFEKYILDQKINTTINNNGKEINNKFDNQNIKSESPKNLSPQSNEGKIINNENKTINEPSNKPNVNTNNGSERGTEKKETKINKDTPRVNQPNAQDHNKEKKDHKDSTEKIEKESSKHKNNK